MPTKEEAKAELIRRGWTDRKIEAYRELRKRGYSHEDIIGRMKPSEIQIDRKSHGVGRTIPKQPWYEKAIEEITEPETMAGIAGGITGGMVAGPPGAVAGAGLAGMGAKAVEQALEPEVEVSPTEIAKAGARQAGYEAVGGILAKIAGKALRPFAKRITEEAKVAINTLDAYMPKTRSLFAPFFEKKVPVLLPAEATENRVLDVLQNIAEYSLVGGKKIADYKNIVRDKAINEMIDDMTRAFGKQADPDLLGDAIKLTVQKRLKGSKLVTEPMYNTVEEMAKDVQVPIEEIKKFAAPIVARAKEIGTIQSKAAGDDLAQAIMELNDTISFPAAKELRSRLLSTVNEFSITNKKAPAIGKAKRLISILDKEMENALIKQQPEAFNLWRHANSLYKQGRKKYDSQFLRRLLKQADPDFGGEPEKILRSIFKKGGISNIRRLKTAVGGYNAPIWKQMKGWYVQDLIIKSTTKDGILQGKSLLYNMRTMGDKALKEIFEPHELRSIEKVGTTLKVIQGRQGEGTGRMLIQLTQGGAALTILGMAGGRGAGQAGAGAIIFGPPVLARLFTDPIAAKLLTQGLKLPKQSGYAISLGLRLSRMANKVEQKIEEEKEIE